MLLTTVHHRTHTHMRARTHTHTHARTHTHTHTHTQTHSHTRARSQELKALHSTTKTPKQECPTTLGIPKPIVLREKTAYPE